MEDVYSRLLPPIQIAPRQNSCKLQNGKRTSLPLPPPPPLLGEPLDAGA